ncbi:hypothetical protein GXW82_24475 [Streptacidiphilus sp. 4-A2]|nr:hypothetical protein [Streptacidiphilus sp. 4-A2]
MQVLSRAWTESATADADYASWAAAVARSCTPNNAPQDAAYTAAGPRAGWRPRTRAAS